MKKFLLVALLFLMVSSVFGQDWVQDINVHRQWYHPQFVLFPAGQTVQRDSTYFFNTKAGDTLYTAIYENVPKMGLFLSIPAAYDSILGKINMYTSEFYDATKMIFHRTLDWSHKDGGARSYVTSIDTAGYWNCNVARASYPGDLYFRLELIFLTGHTLIDTADFEIRCRGHVGVD